MATPNHFLNGFFLNGFSTTKSESRNRVRTHVKNAGPQKGGGGGGGGGGVGPNWMLSN